MDTGCVYGGYLSAIEIQEGKIVSFSERHSNLPFNHKGQQPKAGCI